MALSETADRPGAVLAGTLLGVEAVLGLVLVLGTLLGQMNVAACTGGCSPVAFGVASNVAVLGSIVVVILSGIGVAVTWGLRRSSWWIPIIGIVLVIGCNVAANVITTEALRGH